LQAHSDPVTTFSGLKTERPILLGKFAVSDIYNPDETGTHVLKNEVSGCKLTEDRSIVACYVDNDW